MRYMCLWRPSGTGPKTWKDQAPAEQQRLMAEMGKLIDEMTKSGVLVATGGWDPRGPSKIVKNAAGEVSITDGPYAEAKEAIGGFALIEVKSEQEALEYAKRFVKIAGDGTSEVRALGGP
jgi:hypothetical protein